jgi:hypothetical protein
MKRSVCDKHKPKVKFIGIVMRYFKNKTIKIFALTSVVMFSGCATGPSTFNEANIDRLRIGMLSTEIREMFGAPNEVRTAVCGAATGKQWTCETWRYNRSGSSYQTNDFTFAVESGMKLLNNWKVGR